MSALPEIRSLLDDYVRWLEAQITLAERGEWVEITTPFLDRHNDHIQLYARRENGAYLLSDGSATLQDLELSGCALDTPKRRDLLKTTLNGFGVKLDGDALLVRAAPREFAARKHALVQAVLAVNDLFYLSQPTVASFFLEDVAQWLDLHDVRYVPGVKLPGITGYDHIFDFAIPRSRQQPERILKAINYPSRDAAQALILAWHDTREARPSASVAYAILNDTEVTPPARVLDALSSYSIRSIPWSRREEYLAELAA